MKETWIPVKGWEDFYAVSDQGRVRSNNRTITVLNPWGVLADRNYVGRAIKSRAGKNGYPVVCFTAPGRKRLCVYVHSLVATHFLGPKPEKMEVRHKNGIRDDCRKVNLRWGTRSSNAMDRREHGTFNQPKGEAHFWAKLTDESVRLARKNEQGLNMKQLAKMFGVSHSAMQCAIKRKTWKHVI